MITIRLYDTIANEDNRWWYSFDGTADVFSLERVRRIFAEHPDETDFKFNIHCPGGEVAEGLAIYDFLRTSGKNIYANIEGGCHSMAVVLLLAAPLENRSANPNALALIHKVWGYPDGGTADDLESAAAETRLLQDAILDIYADRTGQPRERLAALMAEQREHGAKELMELGFISRINPYNTNLLFNHKPLELMNLKKQAADLLGKLNKALGKPAANYEFVGEDGEVQFTTESEDDTLEVGQAATPDGTFTIADGRTVVIEGGVITEIRESETETEGEDEVAQLRAEVAELRSLLEEATNFIADVRKNTQSNYVPAGRVGTKATAAPAEPTKEERKNALKDAFEQTKKGGK